MLQEDAIIYVIVILVVKAIIQYFSKHAVVAVINTETRDVASLTVGHKEMGTRWVLVLLVIQLVSFDQ